MDNSVVRRVMWITIIPFVRTTIALIGFVVLGVFGVIDDVSIYRQSIVGLAPGATASFAYGGFIVLWDDDPWLLTHEYGHLLQEKIYGPLHEMLVVIPSVVSVLVSENARIHQSRWFEIEATELGRQ